LFKEDDGCIFFQDPCYTKLGFLEILTLQMGKTKNPLKYLKVSGFGPKNMKKWHFFGAFHCP